MGIFSTSKKSRKLNWIELTSVRQLSEVFSNRSEEPILLFKHSTRCSISAMALNRFENEWDKKICPIYFIDLLKNRDVSDEIECLTKVIHQSPQVIVCQNNKVVYQASHSSIDASEIIATLIKA